MRAHEKAGAYDSMSDGDAFAGQLTNDLQQVSHDKHLRADFNPFKMPPMGKVTIEFPGKGIMAFAILSL